MDELSAPRYIMPMIVSSGQHCDEPQFQTLSCLHYTIFSVVKLDVFMRALTVTRSHSCPENTTRAPRAYFVLISVI